MKRYRVFLNIFILFMACNLSAESDNRPPVSNIYILRAAEQLQAPHVVTYRVAEWAQMRGRWIFPDVGYYDTGYGKDQLWFTGAGADIVHSKHVDWEQEFYVAQEAGPAAHNKRSLWIWPVFDARFRPRLIGQFVAYPSLPLDRAQPWGFDVDRGKIEWAATSHWQAGVGYAGGICAARTWNNSPFLTVSRRTPAGKVELWLERIRGGAQVQLRYFLVTGER